MCSFSIRVGIFEVLGVVLAENSGDDENDACVREVGQLTLWAFLYQ